jgi:hypothetical protein
VTAQARAPARERALCLLQRIVHNRQIESCAPHWPRQRSWFHRPVMHRSNQIHQADARGNQLHLLNNRSGESAPPMTPEIEQLLRPMDHFGHCDLCLEMMATKRLAAT